MKHPHRRIGKVAKATAAVTFTMVVAIPASAQQAAALSETKITLGLGAAYMPRYAGSDEYKAAALPVISVVTPWGGFIDAGEGIGYRHTFGDKFIASAALGFALFRQMGYQHVDACTRVVREVAAAPA